jgi:hypothetical protein
MLNARRLFRAFGRSSQRDSCHRIASSGTAANNHYNEVRAGIRILYHSALLSASLSVPCGGHGRHAEAARPVEIETRSLQTRINLSQIVVQPAIHHAQVQEEAPLQLKYSSPPTLTARLCQSLQRSARQRCKVSGHSREPQFDPFCYTSTDRAARASLRKQMRCAHV